MIQSQTTMLRCAAWLLVATAAGGGASCTTDQPGTLGEPTVSEPLELRLVDVAVDQLDGPLPVDGGVAAMADLDGDGRLDLIQPAGADVQVFYQDGGGFVRGADDGLAGLNEGKLVQVLVGDFDQDGQIDLFLIGDGEPHVQLVRQVAPRSFATASEALSPLSGQGIAGAAVDVDADGDLDVVVTARSADGEEPPAQLGSDAYAELYVNDGTGTFDEQGSARLAVAELAPWGVAAGDVDGDGAVDLLFTSEAAGCRLLVGDGQGVFRDGPPDALPDHLIEAGRLPVLGDLDGDGALDAFVPSATENAILLNDGAGRLIDTTAFVLGPAPGSGHHALFADLDQDGHQDLVIADPAGRLRVLRNDGTHRLFDYSSSVTPTGPAQSDAVSVSAGDVDADGDLDLLVSRAGLARPWLLVQWHPEPFDDGDGDGVPDEVDSCPTVADPDQANQDGSHFSCASGSDCALATGCELAIRDEASAYLVCRNATATWAAARAFCQARGADLVVIGAAGENEFLANLAVPAAWIGLTDAAEEGTFAWVNEEPLGYDSWAEGEPNDSAAAEDCAVLIGGPDGGSWNDLGCDAERSFICEDVVLHLPADPGDACDRCPGIYDPDQLDSDDDGVGDACQTE